MKRKIVFIFMLCSLKLLAVDRDSYKFAAFWEGTDSIMTIQKLASLCAPIFWYSSDEPELNNKEGKDIQIPTSFPFQGDSEHPVVYYQIRNIIIENTEHSLNFVLLDSIKSETKVNLADIHGFDIDYNHYYRHEAGLGGHDHDTEQAQFKVFVYNEKDQNGLTHYYLYLIQATGKAHGLMWYDNIYHLNLDKLDYELQLPFHILVEEGKHASITDMNGDGYYTPGYDVNVRMNDAWGLRDVIRTGELFSSKFESWMAKIRRKEFRVFPPLPDDSPQKSKYIVNGVYAPNSAVYELRPMPSYLDAGSDEVLANDMKGYYKEDWPRTKELSGTQKFYDWWESENFIKSIAVSFRLNDVPGISIAFPLFIVKNVEAPLVGGWLVNRIYMQDKKFRDFGYSILYTPSASRFLDPYFSVGVEWDKYKIEGEDVLRTNTDFVFETGIKFRGNVSYSPFKFLSVLTNFWGARFGIKNKGFMSINKMEYVFEIGAGVW